MRQRTFRKKSMWFRSNQTIRSFRSFHPRRNLRLLPHRSRRKLFFHPARRRLQLRVRRSPRHGVAGIETTAAACRILMPSNSRLSWTSGREITKNRDGGISCFIFIMSHVIFCSITFYLKVFRYVYIFMIFTFRSHRLGLLPQCQRREDFNRP